jgi:Ca2+-binding RTX toxin-like protein
MAFGNDGNDVLDATGTADSNTMLYGGGGNDTLIPGSAGAYTLQGGPGDDTAVFTAVTRAITPSTGVLSAG